MVKAVIIIIIAIGVVAFLVGFIVKKIIAHFFTFGPSQVLIANQVPPLGKSGSFKYRATLATPANGGTLNPATHSIKAISVRLPPSIDAGSASTTTAGYTAGVGGGSMAVGSVQAAFTTLIKGSPPSVQVDLEFVSTKISWTKGEIEVVIVVKDSWMGVSFESEVTYVDNVGIPYNGLTQTPIYDLNGDGKNDVIEGQDE